MTPRTFPAVRTALVPIIFGCDSTAALAVARALATEVVLVGLVPVAPGEAISAGSPKARAVRSQLRELAAAGDPPARARAAVRVSTTPWDDLRTAIRQDDPDLLILDWTAHLAALGVTPSEALARPECDLVLVRGPFPAAPRRVLAPVRGGPHAELALRLALAMQPEHMVALHLTPPGAHTDAPYRGLEHVLRRLPEVETRAAVADDPAQKILEEAAAANVVVIGATAQSLRGDGSLGPVADRVLRDSPAAVLVVKTRRPMSAQALDETAGAQAISILVDKWFAENTFEAAEFHDIERLVELKRARNLTISLALPALNEAETVGKIIRTIKRALMQKAPLLDEIVLIDSNSTDGTREIAAGLGVPVYIHQEVLPEWGARRGKGEALWKSLYLTRGDIVAWIDTDIVNVHPRFVYGILGPLLHNASVKFVKGFYRRPLNVGGRRQAGGGGRVTELTARPMLNLFYPELSGVVQPLSGEYAGRRDALEQLPFYSGYGVETGLLIDVLERFGLNAIAQVDLLERVHHNQPLEALSKMSFAILQAVIHKLERRYGKTILEEVNKSMKLIRYAAGSYFLEVEEIVERERPPMVHVPEYATRPGARP
ncbi:MAG: glucosyl-3-phosphoglycerate synthase [Anaerolineales bacterium]|nr:glucosyl-3-phosphoglycerate synthase [Anaerolineales bacterium]